MAWLTGYSVIQVAGTVLQHQTGRPVFQISTAVHLFRAELMSDRTDTNAITALALTGAVVADYFSATGGGPATLTGVLLVEALTRVIKWRRKSAVQIMCEEVETKDRALTEKDIESVAAISYRYARAAQEGAAQLNLRLLAAAFAGQLSKDELSADEFLMLSDKLSSLSRGEITVLAGILRAQLFIRTYEPNSKRTAYARFEDRMKDWYKMSLSELEACASALQRTGFVVGQMSVTPHSEGTMLYSGTYMLQRLERLIPRIDDVIKRSDNSLHGAPTN